MIKHYNINIFGRVQGVGFRYNTRMKALELKIKGFAQNREDRSVYIEAEGEEDTLNKFLTWCKEGPSWARIIKLNYTESPIRNFTDFEIR
ncbi:MAG: acylphosphatase [Bacteroidales bacterium]|nr:acylphosphatase [Bacteroidales bacterium]